MSATDTNTPQAGDPGADAFRVSVVVPAYNHARFLAEALDSALAQSHPPAEVVVVDDGSTDGTAEIAATFATRDPRVQVIRQSNGGSHAAINRGVAESRFPWIAILNSDDRWHPERLSRLTQAAREGARFVVTGVRLIDEHGRPISDANHWWHQTQRSFQEAARTLGPVDGLLMGNHTVSTSNFFFQRELAARIGPVRRYRYIPDWDWALRAALADPAGYRFLMDDMLLDYRLHGSNAILQQIIRGDLEIVRLHRELLDHHGVPRPLQQALFRNLRDLRRQWRAIGVQAVERHVRDRERDCAELSEALARSAAGLEQSQHWLSERERDIAALQQEVQALRGWLRDRESDVATLTADLQRVGAHRAELQSLVDEAQSSITWRILRRLRRRFGWTRL